MKSPQQYFNEIKENGLAHMEISASSIPEARKAHKEVIAAQKQLRKIKREINTDMKAIRDHYRQQSANAASGSSAVLEIMGKRKTAGKVRAEAKRQLRRDRDRKLEPYDNVKQTIDDLLMQMDSVKIKIRNFIEDVKAEKEALEQSRREKIETLRNLHLDTPAPDAPFVFPRRKFKKEKPDKLADSIDYPEPKPSPPDLKEVNLLGKLFSARRERVEAENQQLQQAFEQDLAKWEEGRKRAEAQLETAKQEYQELMVQWQKEKLAFEEAEDRRISNLQERRTNDVEFMRTLLCDRLNAIEWPTSVAVVLEIYDDGETVHLEIGLPKIDEWPVEETSKAQKRRDYVTHIHSIAFRSVGEVFHVLTRVTDLLISGYVKTPDKRTGQLKKSYLYSVRIARVEWTGLNFDNLEWIDVVDCFEEFEIRRRISSRSIKTIEPF
jgi:hypothetical protein